jgi:hypothetical protein
MTQMPATERPAGARRFPRIATGTAAAGLTVLLLLAAASAGRAQDINPPYPRFGIFTFSGQTYASLDILKDFDIIAITPNNDQARRFKAQNPNVIMLATAAMFINERLSLSGVGSLPESWFYHDVSGNRFEMWGGAWQMNISSFCPKVDMGDGYGAGPYTDFALRWVKSNIDFTVFDGTFHDWWWNNPGWSEARTGDFNNNRIADKDEWGGVDSVNAVWWRSIHAYHEREYGLPGLKYVVVQLGGVPWPNVNGGCYEDFPMYNGPFDYWLSHYTDAITTKKTPALNLFNGAHRFYYQYYPVEPYKNNYRAVRFNLATSLLTHSYFFVDEGNELGHHGNVHIYDEFEAKGKLGYPLSAPIKLSGKALAATPWASGVWVRFFDNGVSIVNATGLPQTITASELALVDPAGASPYYRFLGGQDPAANNGQQITDANPVSLWGDIKMAIWNDPEVFGDGAMLFRTRRTLITPIVVDNHVNNQTSPGSDPVQYSGGWVLSSDGGKYYAFYTGRDYGVFQPNGFAWSPPGTGENAAAYVPTIGTSGMYEVSEWHGYRGSSETSYTISSAVPVRVVCSGKDTSFTINQTRNFGQWNRLGVFPFNKGTAGRVTLTNNASGIVLSDAIRFVYKGPVSGYDTTPPSAPRDVRVVPIQ